MAMRLPYSCIFYPVYYPAKIGIRNCVFKLGASIGFTQLGIKPISKTNYNIKNTLSDLS